MECPSCKGYIATYKEDDKFCRLCGAALPGEFEKQFQTEVMSYVNHAKTPSDFMAGESPDNYHRTSHSKQFAATPLMVNETPAEKYKKLLREIFADGVISPEELVVLARTKNDLGICSSEAIELQRAVADEMGINIDEDEDILSGDLCLEVNISQAYYVSEGCNLEFRAVNVSKDDLYDIKLVGKFVHLNAEKEARVIERRLPAAQRTKSSVFLPFAYDHKVTEVVLLHVSYKDAKNNPCIYESQINFRVFDKNADYHEVQKSINITFQAEKIFGNDMSRLAEITGQGAHLKDDGQKPTERSFMRDQSQQWQRLPLYINEDETNRQRNKILIQKKFNEGTEYLVKARKNSADSERFRPSEQQIAKTRYQEALESFQKARDCFEKVREIDSAHEESLAMIRDVETDQKRLLAFIQKIDAGVSRVSNVSSEKPIVKMTSAQIFLSQPSKKIFLYSKPTISLGRNSGNDVILRLFPNQPETEYPENYRKTLQISSRHAEIINEEGLFYICDIEKNGCGSLNGTFLNGRKVGIRKDRLPLDHECRINIANVLELRCHFLWNAKKRNQEDFKRTSCMTVLGDVSNSCFGINKQSPVNAIRIVRVNNLSGMEEYLILIREITIGRNALNGIVVDHESISDIHAKILFRNDRYWIEDLNSRHGTCIDGKALEPGVEMLLETQAHISIGNVSMNFLGRP